MFCTLPQKSHCFACAPMEDDELVEECQQQHALECTQSYDECHRLYDSGMINAAHQLMLANIENCRDLGPEQNVLYSQIKQTHSFVCSKTMQIAAGPPLTWAQYSLSGKRKGVDDSITLSTSTVKAATFLIEAQLDVATKQSVAVASRLEFADSWMLHCVSESAYVRRLSGYSHIARLTIANPVSSYFSGKLVYVRVETFNNSLFNDEIVVVMSPLSALECLTHNVANAPDNKYVPRVHFFTFSAITFVFSSAALSADAAVQTHVKILVENMQILPRAPSYLNKMACCDVFAKMCRLWANTARRISDMLYDGATLAKLVDFVESSVVVSQQSKVEGKPA